MTLTMTQFVWLLVFAIIGVLFSALLVLSFLLYLICGIRDITYYERHKKDADKCPDKIE